jgi:predicted AAA+ superfamily ATPase
VKTYLERDVRSMINVKDLLVFQRFMKLCAARTGTVLNTHNLSSDVGVSDHTIKHWLSILQASYLIELVPPYFENFGKQAMKSPKLYFTDVGLVAYLLEIETISQIDRDPLRGNLFETMVVMELMKARINQGREPHLYFYRDSQKHEVDIIYKRGAELVAVEIKSSETFHHDFLKGLQYFQKLAGERCRDGYLVYSGIEDFKFGSINVMNFKKSSLIVEEDALNR